MTLKPKTIPIAALSSYVLTQLTLTQFRNYPSLRLDVGPSPVVLTGANGAGKTNILEAISLLSPGRGLRQATLAEMESLHPAGGMGWAVAAHICGPLGEVQLGTAREVEEDPMGEATDKRIVKIDGKKARGQAALGRAFSVLWVTPAMDQLFVEGNSVRRQFLDRLCAGFEPDHSGHVAAYEQAMRERNRLLAMGKQPDNWLSALERQMAEQGIRIAATRNHTLDKLNYALAQAEGTFPKAVLSLSGLAETALQAGQSALEVEHLLMDELALSRADDAQAGRALVGVHRAVLLADMNYTGREAAQCSTGEQKALLLSLILAQARALREWKGAAPLLLLDEVVSHLDASRRAALCAAIAELNVQSWMTGTDESLFSAMEKEAQFLRVQDGRINFH